ncbi:transposase domain-containing protein [Salmonella enterica]|nr:transposase domain-containing protein [Salmonella enterica]
MTTVYQTVTGLLPGVLQRPHGENRAERAIKPVAGTLVARERAAQIMGLPETAKMNGPGASLLTDGLKRLPGWPEENQDELLPFPPYGFSE